MAESASARGEGDPAISFRFGKLVSRRSCCVVSMRVGWGRRTRNKDQVEATRVLQHKTYITSGDDTGFSL